MELEDKEWRRYMRSKGEEEKKVSGRRKELVDRQKQGNEIKIWKGENEKGKEMIELVFGGRDTKW